MNGDAVRQISIRFLSENGDELGGAGIVLPTSVTCNQLQLLCNQLLGSSDDPVPISFFTEHGVEIVENIEKSIDKIDLEKTLCLIYQPQAVFRVQPVTRCSSSMPGHGEPVISAQFSPDGKSLASGSGDTTVRIWDIDTELPQYTCEGHKNWVLCIAWSSDARKIASSCKNGQIMIWDASTGSKIGKTLSGHKQWITHLAWEPMHKDPNCRYLASAGKDANIHIWDTIQGLVVRSLNGHTACVTSLRWGGEGLIYSGSQDRTVKVWRAKDGIICRNLVGHAHWINTLALNTDYVLRTSCFDPKRGCDRPGKEECQKIAQRRYEDVLKVCGGERLVSGSDDFTMFLWNPSESKSAIARLTGHQQLVNQVMFSPDTRYIASASFDKSVKLWCGRTGKFIASLRGHVNAVYQISWSADSRLLVSGSADSTLKVYFLRLHFDLPGHGDEVYTVDWSPEGTKVVSGGKDKVLKLWRH
uniref:WD_REPEATS_REGION domain-containing protein n=1 Tax=Angiostrongylus cantonensis TaxID=6313 RepID=A0A158PCF3_ANGCA